MMMAPYTKPSELILAEGFEEAFIGVGVRPGQPNVPVYSLSVAVDILCDQGMDRDDARHVIYDRVRSIDFGDRTPMWVEEMTVEELRHLVDGASAWVH